MFKWTPIPKGNLKISQHFLRFWERLMENCSTQMSPNVTIVLCQQPMKVDLKVSWHLGVIKLFQAFSLASTNITRLWILENWTIRSGRLSRLKGIVLGVSLILRLMTQPGERFLILHTLGFLGQFFLIQCLCQTNHPGLVLVYHSTFYGFCRIVS